MSNGTAAVSGVDIWQCFPREHVPDVHCADGWKHDETVATGMAWTKVVQVDFIFSLADREFVLVGSLGQEFGFLALEFIHLGHIGFRILVHDAVDGRSKELITACVIAMRMRVDDRGYRLIRHRFDSLEKCWPPSGQFGIDNNNAGVGHEYGSVATTKRILIRYSRAGDDVEIVFHLFDFCRCDRRSRRTLKSGHNKRQTRQNKD